MGFIPDSLSATGAARAVAEAAGELLAWGPTLNYGCGTAAEASIAAGYRTNGTAFAANCRQRANYLEVKSRVASLQGKAAARLTVSLAWIYERLIEIAGRAPYQEEIKTADN